jgi:hypothetical protein
MSSESNGCVKGLDIEFSSIAVQFCIICCTFACAIARHPVNYIDKSSRRATRRLSSSPSHRSARHLAQVVQIIRQSDMEQEDGIDAYEQEGGIYAYSQTYVAALARYSLPHSHTAVLFRITLLGLIVRLILDRPH